MRKLARYISIYKPTQFQRIHTFKNASIHITLSFVAGILLHIPLCTFWHACSNTQSATAHHPPPPLSHMVHVSHLMCKHKH